MKDLILISSIGGDSFSLPGNCVITCDDAHAQRMLDAGLARELEQGEPTEEQLANRHSFVVESRSVVEPVKEVEAEPKTEPEPVAEPAPRTRRRRNAT
jgi:hypothetical protein